MNWFVLVNGVCYLAAAMWSAYKGHGLWSFVWFSYGTSALALAFLEGK